MKLDLRKKKALKNWTFIKRVCLDSKHFHGLQELGLVFVDPNLVYHEDGCNTELRTFLIIPETVSGIMDL